MLGASTASEDCALKPTRPALKQYFLMLNFEYKTCWSTCTVNPLNLPMPTPLPDWTLSSPIEPRILDWVSEETLDWFLPRWFEKDWVNGQTTRSPFFVESDLVKAHSRIREAIKASNPNNSSEVQPACCPKHSMTRGDLLRQMDEALSAFLTFPVTPIPPLPMDILLEIIVHAVEMDWGMEYRRWSFVCKDVFERVEPMFWRYLDSHSCRLFSLKEISPRFEKASKYVRQVFLFGDGIDHEDFGLILNRVCNVRILELHNFDDSTFPLPLPTLPFLTRLDARSPLTFGVAGTDGIVRPDFSAPIFRNLTHIYLDLSNSMQQMLNEKWEWSFESMARLQFIRFYLYRENDSYENFLPYFEEHIARRLPSSLRGCLMCGEDASPAAVDVFLALDPRIVWAFNSDEV
ncbi:hypothetical protein DL96DRAFT_1688202, partial [Flagelloscypha sp. PMI_526]